MKSDSFRSTSRDIILKIEREKNLLFSTPHAVYYKFNDSPQKYSYFSPSIEELTGYTSKELKDLGLESKGQNQFFSRYWMESKNGNWKLIENFAFNDEHDNKLPSIAGFMRDVTPLNSYLHEVIQEKEKLNSIIELAEVILLVLDKEGKVELINKKTCDVLGYEREEIIGKKWCRENLRKNSKSSLIKQLMEMKK